MLPSAAPSARTCVTATASRGPHNRGMRALTVALVALGLAVAVPVAVIVLGVLAFRWIDPPVTAFMLGDRWRGTPVRHAWHPLEATPATLVHAVLAAEDGRFCRHAGFDAQAIAGALAQARAGGPLVGASTVSQQVARNLFLWRDRSWVRKALEAWITVGIEQWWPKRRIAEVYLNIAQFGPGTYGIVEGARLRLGPVPLEAIDASRAATLATALPAPRVLGRAPTEIDQQRRLGIAVALRDPRIGEAFACIGPLPQ